MQNLTQMLMQQWGSAVVRQVTNRDTLLLTTSAMMAMLLVGCGDDDDSNVDEEQTFYVMEFEDTEYCVVKNSQVNGKVTATGIWDATNMGKVFTITDEGKSKEEGGVTYNDEHVTNAYAILDFSYKPKTDFTGKDSFTFSAVSNANRHKVDGVPFVFEQIVTIEVTEPRVELPSMIMSHEGEITLDLISHIPNFNADSTSVTVSDDGVKARIDGEQLILNAVDGFLGEVTVEVTHAGQEGACDDVTVSFDLWVEEPQTVQEAQTMTLDACTLGVLDSQGDNLGIKFYHPMQLVCDATAVSCTFSPIIFKPVNFDPTAVTMIATFENAGSGGQGTALSMDLIELYVMQQGGGKQSVPDKSIELTSGDNLKVEVNHDVANAEVNLEFIFTVDPTFSCDVVDMSNNELIGFE